MSRKEFAELGKELERWPTEWRIVHEAGEWVGRWSGASRGTHEGEQAEIDGTHDSDYAAEFAAFVAQLVNSSPKMLGHIDALESAIRETIPALQSAGRAVLAAKLRKLVDG